ncbi:MAG: hypothetical protein WC790_03070 [Candidatus Paceibacterota bacterium]|jgi:alpha/beta superfamily hydrolase
MIYYIPGAKDTKKDSMPLLRVLKGVKFLPLYIDDVYNLPKLSSEDTLIGFSYGAVTSYLLALQNKEPLKHLVLCSLPPVVFHMKKPHAKKISVLVGTKEGSEMVEYAKKLSKKWSCSLTCPSASHNMTTKTYVDAVLKILQRGV